MSSPTDEVSTKERLKLCCKPRYKMRRIKRKGAFLVLAWNILACFVLWYILDGWYREYIYRGNTTTIIDITFFGFTLPLAGWLADACIGRYKMIYCSVWVMWAATILVQWLISFWMFTILQSVMWLHKLH